MNNQMNNQIRPPPNDLILIYVRFLANGLIILSLILMLLQLIGIQIFQWFSKSPILSGLYGFLLIICVALYIIDRNFYLPFLGYSVYPCGSLSEKRPNNADISVSVKVKPNVNVIYWASESSPIEKQPISNPWDAYANYDNAGVARANSDGNAVLWVRSPSSYRVGLFNRKLERHIHYRECNYSGMLSEVKTVIL